MSYTVPTMARLDKGRSSDDERAWPLTPERSTAVDLALLFVSGLVVYLLLYGLYVLAQDILSIVGA